MMKMRVDWKVEHVVLMSQFIVNFFLILFRVVSNREPKTKTFDFNDPWKGNLSELFAVSSVVSRSKQWRNKRRLRVPCDRRIEFFIAASHFPTPSKGFKLNWKSLVRRHLAWNGFCFYEESLALHFFRLPGGWRLELLLSFLPKMAIKTTRHRRRRPQVHNIMTSTKDFFPRLTEIPSHAQAVTTKEHKKKLFEFI